MRALLAIYLLCLLVSAAHASNDPAFFWKVEANPKQASKAVVYLLGSVHVADSSFYPLRQRISTLFQASDHLVVELDSTKIDADVYRRLMTEKGVYGAGETIADHVSAETLSALKRQLQLLKMPYSSMAKYKPGTLVMTISMLQVMNMGYSPELGIDLHFLSQAKDKNVIELESLQEQINLLLDITQGDLLLQETLSSMEKSGEMIEQLMAIWKRGDEKAMEKLLLTEPLAENPSFTLIYDKLFFERNAKMTDKIKNFFTTDDVYFVIVGAGHLISEYGIVNILQQQGYVVERL